MARARIVFNPELRLPLDAPAAAPRLIHPCEVPSCRRPAPFGVRAPGWASIHTPCRWFCGEHRPREAA